MEERDVSEGCRNEKYGGMLWGKKIIGDSGNWKLIMKIEIGQLSVNYFKGKYMCFRKKQ